VTPITVATNTAGTPIPVGHYPHGVAITTDGATVYVTNWGDNSVTPITVATNTTGTPITVGSHPEGIAITPSPADTTPPVLALPDSVTRNATSPTGATITYTVSATDDTDPNPVVVCIPPSGNVFAIGTTTVHCTATDSSGNSANASFAVHVKGAAEQLTDLGNAVKGVGPGTSLADKVKYAQAALGRNDVPGTCSILGAFINEVKGQTGGKILPSTASTLITDATRIKTVLGC
jgi:YVTN family beta-propeller protein